MTKVRALLPAILVVLAGCPAETQVEPAAQPPPPPPPPSPPVTLLELIPPDSSAALLIDVAAARETQVGLQIVESLLRLAGMSGWEQALEVDIANDVDRVLVTGRINPEAGAPDLTRLLSRRQVETMEMALELSADGEGTSAVCRESDLVEARFTPVSGPRAHSQVARCGRLVITSCCVEQPAPPVRRATAIARELARLPAPVEGERRVGTIVMGPDVLQRATCERERIELVGWQAAVAELGEGLRIRGWLHAAQLQQAPALRECVLDGVGELGDLALLRQLGISALLREVRVEQSQADSKDVIVEVPLDAEQTSFLMALMGMIDGSQMP